MCRRKSAAIIEGIKQQDLHSIAKAAVKQLFDVLSDTFDLEIQAQIFGEEERGEEDRGEEVSAG